MQVLARCSYLFAVPGIVVKTESPADVILFSMLPNPGISMVQAQETALRRIHG